MKDLVKGISELTGFYLAMVLPMFVGVLMFLLHMAGFFLIAWLFDVASGGNEVASLVAIIDSLKGVQIMAVGLFFGAMGGTLLARQSDK